MELETHLFIAGKLGYLKQNELEPLLSRTAEVGRMLAGLTRALRKKRFPET